MKWGRGWGGSPVEVLAKLAANAIERNGVDAAVHESQTKAHDSEDVPELIIVLLGVRIDVEPEREYVLRKEAYREYRDKR